MAKAKRIEIEMGAHVNEAKRQAVFCALREKRDVVFEFNEIYQTVTLDEAKLLFPKYLKKSLSQVKDSFRMLQENLELLQNPKLVVV